MTWKQGEKCYNYLLLKCLLRHLTETGMSMDQKFEDKRHLLSREESSIPVDSAQSMDNYVEITNVEFKICVPK